MKKTYELTPAQKMHYRWIRQYRTQQVAGLSIVASIKADIDFDILKKAILLEYQRYGCMRVRFTEPDEEGEVKQYLSDEKITDIPIKDLSDMTMEDADAVMQKWAYETFDGDNIPMCEVFLMKLPEGYNGFFIHMDHRLIDSCGVVVMTNDIMALYTHFKFGSELPEDLADYEEVLTRDLEKEQNPKRFAKDKKFWDEQLDKFGEPLYSDIQGPEVLERARKKHRKKSLRAADIEKKNLFVQVKDYPLEEVPTKEIIDFCMTHNLSITNLLLLGIRTYLSKQNGGQEDISIQNFISRRSTKDEWTSGGSRTVMFPCRTVISQETTFMEAAYIIQNTQNGIYLHAGYDPALIYEEIKKRYKTPKDTTYESCYLTYQPMPVKPDNPYLKEIPMHNKWFANGAATKKMYLTVTHTPDGGMNFSYHYQVADLGEKNMELLHYYLMRIIFRGMENSDMTIGKIIETV
ncbi:condensation domain-containing protein [Butyrivibrio sp. MC2021]|uniref:condensation domain-containing protein n=1 Tax=Butyrivibrio sp. MC2021 TaxID=1408306 RepID=UPI00047B1A87|nr:condensation domain-containing protein [Butyrivibrio sp. MC2021]